jgi:hypothetical protein
MFVTSDGRSHYEAGKSPIRLGRYCTFVLFQRNLSSCLFFTVSDSICACVLVHATRPTHLIVLDLIALMLFDEDYKSWSSSLCNFLQSSVYSSLWGPTTYSRSHQYGTVRPWQPAGTFAPGTDRLQPSGNTVSHCWHRAALLSVQQLHCETGMLQRAAWNRGNINGSWRRKFHSAVSCYLTSNSLFIDRRSLCYWTSVLGFRHLSPILIPSFRPFVTGFDESGWAPVAGESYSRTIVVLRLSLFGVRPSFSHRM